MWVWGQGIVHILHLVFTRKAVSFISIYTDIIKMFSGVDMIWTMGNDYNFS